MDTIPVPRYPLMQQRGGGGVAQLGIYQNCKLGEDPLVRLFAGEVQTNWDSV